MRKTKLVRFQILAVRMDWDDDRNTIAGPCSECRQPTRGRAVIAQAGTAPQRIIICLPCAMGVALAPVAIPFQQIARDLERNEVEL